MAVTKIGIEEFLHFANHHQVIDVRSPGEYLHAHIPDAYSLPLFTDEERKIVGTAYKQESRQKAIRHGLDFFGVKMRKMVEEVETMCDARCRMPDVRSEKINDTLPVNYHLPSVNSKEIANLKETDNSKTVLIHCWRGGMRSGAVAWLLDLYGFKVYTLDGGYKAFRNWVLQQFLKNYPLKIIGGYTGSGKTQLLAEMKKKGEVVIDLEALANHKGSAFGGIGQGPQPSPEMFENRLAVELWKAINQDDRCKMTDDIRANHNMATERGENKNLSTVNYQLSTKAIWLEDESQRIGNINIPIEFWKTMRSKPVVFLDIPFEERLKFIVNDYGKGDKDKLVNAIIRIQKRLGGLETKAAINFLVEDNIGACFRILLAYYDKQYKKGLQGRENLKDLIIELQCDTIDSIRNSQLVLQNKRQKQDA